MENKDWVLAKQDALQILSRQDDYNLVKKTVIKSIDDYMEFVKGGSAYTQSLVKRNATLRLEIFYCDQTHIIDCSNFCVIDSRFYSCIEAHKQLHKIGEDENHPTYRKIFDFLYTNGAFIYQFKEGEFRNTGLDFSSGISSFIMYIASQAFTLQP